LLLSLDPLFKCFHKAIRCPFLVVEEEVWLDELQLHEPYAFGGFDKVQAGVEDVLLALSIHPLDSCLLLCAERHGVLGAAQVIVRPKFTGLGYFDDGMTEVVVEEDGRRFALSNLREKLLHEHLTRPQQPAVLFDLSVSLAAQLQPCT